MSNLVQKKELGPEDFLTRAERKNQMKIPESSYKSVIVSSNNEALGFRFNCYHEKCLKSKVDKQTFDATVKQATKICEDAWRRKRYEENAEYSKALKFILYFAIFISNIAFLLLILLIYGPGDEGLLYAAIILISLAGILTIGVVIKSMFTLPKFMVLEDTIIYRLNEFLEKENNLIYRSLGLYWVMQEKFYWLELRILNPKEEDEEENE